MYGFQRRAPASRYVVAPPLVIINKGKTAAEARKSLCLEVRERLAVSEGFPIDV